MLERTGALDAAYEAAGGYKSRLIGRLENAEKYLRTAREDLRKYKTAPEVRELIVDCAKALDALKRISGVD